MGKIIAIIVIAIAAWFIYSGNLDLNKAKDSSIEALKKEKTINAVTGSRARTQEDIDNVTK